MADQTSVFGFPIEETSDEPGHTLREPDSLAQAVEDALQGSTLAESVLSSMVDEGNVPGQRIATSIETSESAGFENTELTVHSVTADLVSGRTYRITWYGSVRSDNAGDVADVGIREDDSGGDEIQTDRCHIASTTSFGFGFKIEVEFTAGSTGSKTFIGHLRRLSGSGTLNYAASSSRPRYMSVDYIRD